MRVCHFVITSGDIAMILILGIINFILVLLQLCSGLHLIKLSFAFHKRSGIVLVVTASLHGLLALLA
jgi:hypothetical protein